MESITVQLTYFKRNGKFYDAGEFPASIHTPLYLIWESVRDMQEQGKLPGLVDGAGKEFNILVNAPGHPDEHPHIVMTAHTNETEDRIAQLQEARDEELEACIAWFDKHIPGYELVADCLRAARRPKPSLKKQALAVLEEAPGPDYPRAMTVINADQHALIRRALEDLPND